MSERPAQPAARAANPLSGRSLSRAQVERLRRLCIVARELACEGGYAAVTMRAVAERAGVGLATVYRYFASKDHLLAEVHARRTAEVLAGLAERPPRGRSPARRVAAVFERMLEAVALDPRLAAAAVAAAASGDAISASPDYWYERVMRPYLDLALGELEAGDRRELAEILGHVFFSLMSALAAGRKSLGECERVMGTAIARVMGGVRRE